MSGLQTYQALNIAAGVLSAAARAPQKPAVVCEGNIMSYAELATRIQVIAQTARKALSLRAGDRVLLSAPNCPEYSEIVLGLAYAGIATVTLSPFLTAAELEMIVEDSKPRGAIIHGMAKPSYEALDTEHFEFVLDLGGAFDETFKTVPIEVPPPRADETDAFAIAYTSGTTGKPKGVVLSHRSRVLTFFAMAAEYGCYGPDDTALCLAPMFHGAGLAFALAPIFFGGTAYLMGQFDPEATLALLQDSKATNVFMVPTHFHAIFALAPSTLEKFTFPHLKTIISNAAPLPQSTKTQIVEYFGEGKLFECYGSTEAGIVSNLRPADQLRKTQCVGQAFSCTEIQLLDDDGQPVKQGKLGEVFTRSPYIFNGYWEQDETTKAAMRGEWFSAGDLGRFDEDGYLYIEGRKKDMIISGGINIYPREIEELLHTHVSVAEAAVVGVPDERWGERVVAFVVPETDEQTDEDVLLTFCAKGLTKHKVPKQVVFIDEIPRNPSGKILKRVLRDQHSAEA